jgi:hypothetical protein
MTDISRLHTQVGQNWTKLRSTVDPESVDVYLPPAPNLFAVRPLG